MFTHKTIVDSRLTKLGFILLIVVLAAAFPGAGECKPRLVKILVSSPHIGERSYSPVADVMAGSIIRELKRHGGLEIIDRDRGVGPS